MNIISLEDYKRRKAEKFVQEWEKQYVDWRKLAKTENQGYTKKGQLIVMRPPPNDAA